MTTTLRFHFIPTWHAQPPLNLGEIQAKLGLQISKLLPLEVSKLPLTVKGEISLAVLIYSHSEGVAWSLFFYKTQFSGSSRQKWPLAHTHSLSHSCVSRSPSRASSGLQMGCYPQSRSLGRNPHTMQNTARNLTSVLMGLGWRAGTRETFLTMEKFTGMRLGIGDCPPLAPFLQSVFALTSRSFSCLLPGFRDAVIWFLPNPMFLLGLSDLPFLLLCPYLFFNSHPLLRYLATCLDLSASATSSWWIISGFLSPFLIPSWGRGLNFQLFTTHMTLCPVSSSIKWG